MVLLQPKKTKKFIDRKNAVTFHLVHRSQQDPLAADESAPQRVLLPVLQPISKVQNNTNYVYIKIINQSL